MRRPVAAESHYGAGTWQPPNAFGTRRFISFIIIIIVLLDCRNCRGAVTGGKQKVTISPDCSTGNTFQCAVINNSSRRPEMKSCITAERRCDFIVDCPGGDDEANCDFVCNFDDINNADVINGNRITTKPCPSWSAPLASDSLPGFIIQHGPSDAPAVPVDLFAAFDSISRGPSTDHSSVSGMGGFALFVNVNHTEGGAGTSAELLSPWYGVTTNFTNTRASTTDPDRNDGLAARCRTVHFAINMFGSDVGQLHLLLRLSDPSEPFGSNDTVPTRFNESTLGNDSEDGSGSYSSTPFRRVWSAFGDKGSRWLNYSVPLGILRSSFQLVFRVIRGDGDSGHVAIDSISVRPCNSDSMPPEHCPTSQFQCGNHLCVGAEHLCDTESDCLEGDDELPIVCGFNSSIGKCDFEQDFCGWRVVTSLPDDGSGFTWQRTSGKNGSVNLGPRLDHTTSTDSGHFAYVVADESDSSDSADTNTVLISPVLPAPLPSTYDTLSKHFGTCQLRFFYHLFGRHVTGLDVHVIETRASSNCGVTVPTSSTGGDVGESGSTDRLMATSRPFCKWKAADGGKPWEERESTRIYRRYRSIQLPTSNWDGYRDVWLRASIPLPYLTRSFVIMLEVSKGHRYSGDMAIDDVTFSPACFSERADYHHAALDDKDQPRDKQLIEYVNTSLRYSFGTCGSRGNQGPTQHQCDIAYQGQDRPRVAVVGSDVGDDYGGRIPAGVQVWTVPQTALYSITAIGASGGTGMYNGDRSRAGYVHAKFELRKGEHVYILVGQRGEDACGQDTEIRSRELTLLCRQGRPQSNSNDRISLIGGAGGAGGGGGASYVFKFDAATNRSELLLVAGGGGGRSVIRGGGSPGSADGGLKPPGPGTSAVIGGEDGSKLNNSEGYRRPGGGGGWFVRRSGYDLNPTDGQGLSRQLNTNGNVIGLSEGGRPCPGAVQLGFETTGGFGGGGGACSAGGGGGGFTGGDASANDNTESDGEGGSSFIDRNGTAINYESGATVGDGAVEIVADLDCPCEYMCIFTDITSNRFQCYCPANYELAEDRISCLDEESSAERRTTHRNDLSLPKLLLIVAIVCGSMVMICTIVICVRRQCMQCIHSVVGKMTKSDRLERLCRLPPLLVSSSHSHTERRPDREHQLQEPILLVDCPLDPQLWPDTIFAAHGGPPSAGTEVGVGAGGALQLVVGGMVTEYNPTYDYGGLGSDAAKGRGLAGEHGLYEIAADRLQLIRSIGHGAFGEVFEGIMKEDTADGQLSDVQVAAKTLSGVINDQTELDFLLEALIMSKFNHPNVVRFIGVCFQLRPRIIVLELLEGGDLKTFLRQSRPSSGVAAFLTQLDLVKLALDVASGCEHLEQNHFIHRDIAARNCLLTCKGPGRTAKIADFGMARDIYSADYYRKGGRAMLPVKWMPPEAFLDGIFTSKTDIWSFGVLMWEVFSLGYMPYPGFGNQEVMQLVADGGRLDPPTGCPGSIYDIMTSCWREEPEVVNAEFPNGVLTLYSPQTDTVISDSPDITTSPTDGSPRNAEVDHDRPRQPMMVRYSNLVDVDNELARNY